MEDERISRPPIHPSNSPRVRWKEQKSDKDFFGDDWPDNEAVDHQINEIPEVRRTLRRFVADEAPTEDDGTIDIDEYIKQSEATTANAVEASGQGTVLTPVDLSHMEGVDLAQALWKKRVLPFADVRYKGRVLKFTKDLAQKVAENFKKKPFDQVIFNFVDKKNAHNDDPLRVAGEVTGMEVGNDGLYATIKTNDRGTEYLKKENPNIGVSVRFHPNFHRDWDNTKFGPVVQHIAATPDPHITGLGPWAALKGTVSLSGTTGAVTSSTATTAGFVVDLSRETYEVHAEAGPGPERPPNPNPPPQPKPEGQSEGESIVEANAENSEAVGAQEGGVTVEDVTRNPGATPEGGAESESNTETSVEASAETPAETSAETTTEVSTSTVEAPPAQLSAEAQATIAKAQQNADQIVEMGRKLEAAEAALRDVRNRERRQAVRRMLEVQYPDVAPFALSAAENLLLSAEGDGPNAGAFELSATGEASIKDGSIGEQVKSMLDACKQKVDMGRERGTSAQAPADQDSVTKAMEKHNREYSQYLRMAGIAAPAPAAPTTVGGGE